jgi:hypothetical protein
MHTYAIKYKHKRLDKYLAAQDITNKNHFCIIQHLKQHKNDSKTLKTYSNMLALCGLLKSSQDLVWIPPPLL